MLLAPFALADSPSHSRASRRSRYPQPLPARVPAWLLIWAVLGTLIVLLVPVARGGSFGGWTAPFWFAVAPWLDIVWLLHRRWLASAIQRLG